MRVCVRVRGVDVSRPNRKRDSRWSGVSLRCWSGLFQLQLCWAPPTDHVHYREMAIRPEHITKQNTYCDSLGTLNYDLFSLESHSVDVESDSTCRRFEQLELFTT